MTRRVLVLIGVLMMLGGVLLRMNMDVGPTVTPVLAQAEPTATRPPVPPLPTATPEPLPPTATPVQPPPSDDETPAPEPPSPTPTVIAMLPEAGGRFRVPSVLFLSLGLLLVVGAIAAIPQVRKTE